jgi:hypothetical protein
MSYQAQAFVRNIRGASRGEKALLMTLSFYHDHRNGQCRVSNAQLAQDAEMSERHVITLIQQLELRHILKRRRDRDGRGSITSFEFVGMCKKGELASSLAEGERVKSATGKGEICAQKGELASSPNKERAVEASTTENLIPPNPPFSKGGILYRLTHRDHVRLSRYWERDRNALTDTGRGRTETWAELIRIACADLVIKHEDAVHDLVLMDPDLWAARLELKKAPESVSA